MGRKRDDAIRGSTRGLFAQPRPEDTQPPKPKKRAASSMPISTRVKTPVGERLDAIAEKNGVTRSALVHYILARWVRSYDAGKVKLEFEESRALKLDE